MAQPVNGTMENRVFIVLGATGGIGQELCSILVKQGAFVAAASRNHERLAALKSNHSDGNLHILPVDATITCQVDQCFSDVKEKFGRIDGAVNLVGSMILKPAHLTTDNEWSATLLQNLHSAFSTVHAAGKTMKPGGGSVVLLSSAAAQIGLPNHEAIAAAKAGVIGLTRSAAATYASKNIRFNAVAPGLVKTPLAERITSNPSSLQASNQLHPLGRIGEPAEVARLIAWLLDPANSWITGQVIGIDGGLASIRK